MDVKIKINKCEDCKHVDHTGAFTPNGAVTQCHHPDGVKNFSLFKHTRLKDHKGVYIRKVSYDSLPKDCPLKDGARY